MEGTGAAKYVEGIDPHPLLETEQLRAIRFFETLDESGWQTPTACTGWRRREMVAHLASGEDYNLATLDGTREALVAQAAGAGVNDLHSFNAWAVRRRAEQPASAVLEEMRQKSATVRAGLRERGEGELDTMAGPYSARLQAFHLAFEAAIHNDDMSAPIEPGERAGRDAWRAATARFMVAEEDKPVEMSAGGGATRVRNSDTGEEATLPDADMVLAASRRLNERAGLYPASVVEALKTFG